MEKASREMFDTIPAGYYRVASGPIRADDLVYNWPGRNWERHDWPGWTSKVADAVDAVGVVRRPGIEPGFEGSRARIYTVRA